MFWERIKRKKKNQTFVENIYVFLYLLGNIGAGWRVWRKMNEKANVEIYQRKSGKGWYSNLNLMIEWVKMIFY